MRTPLALSGAMILTALLGGLAGGAAAAGPSSFMGDDPAVAGHLGAPRVDWGQRLDAVDTQVRTGAVGAATRQLQFYLLTAPPGFRARIDLSLANIRASEGDWERALANGRDALGYATGSGTYLEVARLFQVAGKPAEALRVLHEGQARYPAPELTAAARDLEQQLAPPSPPLAPVVPWLLGLAGGALVTAAGVFAWRRVPRGGRPGPEPAVPAEAASGEPPIAYGPRFLPIGHDVGTYRILRVVGSTLNSTLYCAEDTKLHRQVALKVVNSGIGAHQTDNALARFQKEVQSLISLAEQHPGVVKVYDYLPPGTLVTEWVEGKTLEDVGDELPIDRILQVGIELCEVLAAAHALGIVHRDIKPSNVMFVAGTGHVKLLDFGIAKNANLGTSNLTLDSNVPIGTFTYMAPEQFAASNQAKAASDVYSLGLTLYRLITGQMPTEPWFGPRTFGLMTADQFLGITADSPAIARYLGGGGSISGKRASDAWIPELDAVIRKSFAEVPANRFSSADVFGKELARIWHHLSISVRA